METDFILMTGPSTKKRRSRIGYRRIALCEVESGTKPAFIGWRAKGMVRVVEVWDDLHVGSTSRSMFQRAWVEAQQCLWSLVPR